MIGNSNLGVIVTEKCKRGSQSHPEPVICETNPWSLGVECENRQVLIRQNFPQTQWRRQREPCVSDHDQFVRPDEECTS